MPSSFGDAFPPDSAIGELARSRDWSSSPLGEPAQWPNALQHAFGLCLDSPVFMSIYWGPEYCLIYGDSYRPLLADKHPAVFGRPGNEAWSEIWSVIHPDLKKVRETGQGFSTASQRLDMLHHGVPQERYFSYTLMPLRDEHGVVAGVLSFATDSTVEVMAQRARSQALARLDSETARAEQTRDLLQMLTDGTPDVIYVKDTAGRMVHANDTVSRMFNMPRSEILGRDDTAWLPPGQAAIVMANDRSVMTSRQTREMEEVVQIKGPTGPVTRLYLSTKSPWIATDGTLLGMFGISRDITERKAQEDELRRLNETLEARVAERTLERDRIWRVSREVFVVSGPDGGYQSVNPAFERTLGWTFEEAISQPVFGLLHPDDLDAASAQFRKVVTGETAVGFECRMRHRDGGYRWLNWTAVAEGELVYAVGRDVTAEHQQAETLAHAEEQLRQAQKMEAVGQLTGGIAHDFNNLLATIMTSLELLQRRLDNNRLEDLPRYIRTARSSAQRAASLTHRLLAFSRQQSLDLQPVDVNQLVTSMEELMQRTLGENVDLRVALDPCLPRAFTDANQLESAMLNLAINARDAMPYGGKLTIETVLTRLDERYASENADLRPGEYLQLSVSDTGTGMTPAVVAKAFDPFFTTKPIGQGTGLGLSMIYGYAKQAGGHAAIYSEPGMGTTVKLYLPRFTEDVADPVQAAPVPAVPQGAGESVLVVEDEPGVRMAVMEVLDELGYRAYEAVDAPSALAIVASGVHLDLLVSDVGLPGMNGRQLAETIRSMRPGLRVLFITGYAGQAAIRGQFLDAGMDMLSKPFVIDDLARKIREMLQP